MTSYLAKDLIDVDLVNQHIFTAERYVGSRAGNIFLEGVINYMQATPSLRFESPLEAVFWVWWTAVTHDLDEPLGLAMQRAICPQGEKYRLDFVVFPLDSSIENHPNWRPLAVEVDGHEFHERTPEQVAIRDRRDRALQVSGWQVFHYSFAELTTRPAECVWEVLMVARRQLHHLRRSLAGRADVVG